MPAYLTDSGPLVALLDRSERHHQWAREQFDHVRGPILTCEGVIAETAYLINSAGIPPWSVLELVEREVITIRFDLELSLDRVLSLMRKYADTPMDFVDACLVSMTESKRDCQLLTMDSDFHVYRRFERQTIPLLAPAQ
ncbi:MAG TPA: pilus assembly protein [Verrucomicrobia subdivision 3 bacterium]|jgi:predicted nucleic acid-binding protein|nr:pilus assembly protein [Limisphaerales bacterium]